MKATAKDTPDITLRSPADLLSAVPYLLGYVPSDSLVVIGLDTETIALTACTRLPEREEPAANLAVSADVLRRNAVDAAVVVGYGAPERVTRCVDYTRGVLAVAGVQLVEALRVTDGRYWSYVCASTQCCPAAGTALPPANTVVDASFAFEGAHALPNRDAMIARMAPVTGRRRTAVTRAARRLQQNRLDNAEDDSHARRQRARQIVQRHLEDGAQLPDVDDTVLLAAALADNRIRDYALTCIDRHGPRRTVELWMWVFRHATRAQRADAGGVLGYASWRSGNGVVAAEAVRRALDVAPAHKLARLMCEVLEAGHPPSKFAKLGDDSSGQDDDSDSRDSPQ